MLAPTGRLGMFGVSSLASGKERNILSMLSMLANTPWFQFNPLGLMNANKGVFGVNIGHMWDEIDRLRGGATHCWSLPHAASSDRKWRQASNLTMLRRRITSSMLRNVGKVLLVP